MVFVADAQGRVDQRSAALERRFGADALSVGALADAASQVGLSRFLEELRAGASGEHTFTAAGGGKLRCEVRRADDGALYGALHVVDAETTTARIERRLLRALMENLDIVLWAVDRPGFFVYHDGKALEEMDMAPGQLLGLNVFELYGEEGSKDTVAAFDGVSASRHELRDGIYWNHWFIPLPNEEGVIDHVAGFSLDVSKAKQVEATLKKQLETVELQQEALKELEVPLIEVWDKVLTVPVVGVIDSQRANSLIDRLLTEVSRAGALFAILDLTGVEALDTSTAGHLLKLISSIRLLGAEGVITGISPHVAQTIVGIGVDLKSVKTCANLRDGLRYCMAKMGA
ncbi:MAG: STAS domain-containing protein [Myxococcales bacterium]|nr:STAS domain-containing protein [Myxococcales bacterium]